jgi:hypothetical protein
MAAAYAAAAAAAAAAGGGYELRRPASPSYAGEVRGNLCIFVVLKDVFCKRL